MSEEPIKPDPEKKPKRPRDANQLAKLVVELATGSDDGVRANAEDEPTVEPGEGSAVEPQPEDNHDNSDTAADSGDQAGATGEDESNASTGESKAGSKKPRKTTT